MNILLVSNSSKSIWLFRRNIILNLKNKGFNIYVFANSDDYIKKVQLILTGSMNLFKIYVIMLRIN